MLTHREGHISGHIKSKPVVIAPTEDLWPHRLDQAAAMR